MHPKSICIIITLALACAAFAEPGWVSFGKGTEGQTPQLTVLESSFAGTAINLVTPGMWVENVIENDETYQRVTLTGSSFTSEVGKPMLPVVHKLVAIPATAGVTVTVEVNTTTTLKDYLVYPTQPPVIDKEPAQEFQIDEKFYELDTLYPVELSEVGAPAIMNDVRLVELTIQPFRYNPAKKELTVATDLTVRLDYSGIDPRNMLTQQQSQFSPQWERLYRALLLNFTDIYTQASILDVETGIEPTVPIPEHYLIIYAHNFHPEVNPKLQEFIDWKEKMGFVVETKDLNNITGPGRGVSAVVDVRDTISHWFYWTIAPGKYVLLVGDANNFIPVPIGRPNYDPVKCADSIHVPTYYYAWFLEDDSLGTSDYYYQLLAGTDSFPDLCVGRWCVEDSTDLALCVNKTFWYEKTPYSGWNPYKALMVGHTDYWWCKDTIVDSILYPAGYDSIFTEYGCRDCGGTNAGVISAIQTSPGLGIVNYRGHGVDTAWYGWNINGESFTTALIHSLNQSSFKGYPVVYNVSCHNGKFTNPNDESMVEAWTLDPDGGAVGTLGASQESGTSVNDVFDQAIFRGHFQQYLNCEMAVNYGKCRMIEFDQRPGLWAAKIYHWIGDPALDVWRGRPDSASLTITANPIKVIVYRVSDNIHVANALVCVHRDGGGYHQIRYTDANGVAIFPDPTLAGTYYVTATNQWGPDICIKPAFGQFFVSGGGGQEAPPSDIIEWELESVYPNPAASSITIRYSVAGTLDSKETHRVELSVFDVSGRRVKVLESASLSPGHYTVTWNKDDNGGARCANGVYFIRLEADGFEASRRLVLLR